MLGNHRLSWALITIITLLYCLYRVENLDSTIIIYRNNIYNVYNIVGNR